MYLKLGLIFRELETFIHHFSSDGLYVYFHLKLILNGEGGHEKAVHFDVIVRFKVELMRAQNKRGGMVY